MNSECPILNANLDISFNINEVANMVVMLCGEAVILLKVVKVIVIESMDFVVIKSRIHR